MRSGVDATDGGYMVSSDLDGVAFNGMPRSAITSFKQLDRRAPVLPAESSNLGGRGVLRSTATHTGLVRGSAHGGPAARFTSGWPSQIPHTVGAAGRRFA